jgi:hypothetical protein
MLPLVSAAWPHPNPENPEPFPGLREFSRLSQFRFTLAYQFHLLPFLGLTFWLNEHLTRQLSQPFLVLLNNRIKLPPSMKLARIFRIFSLGVHFCGLLEAPILPIQTG